MDTRTLQLLDYYTVRDTISGYCMSEEGQAFFKNIEPASSADGFLPFKKFACDWTKVLQLQNPVKMCGWTACAGFLPLVGIEGSVLEVPDVYALGMFCRATEKVRTSLLNLNEKVPVKNLLEVAEAIPPLANSADEIFRIIDEKGEMRDLPQIRAIRNTINKIRREIASLLKNYTTDIAFKDSLQSDMPTIRGERQVLAVKANFKGRIPGIVHEMSQTGQTVFIEPEDVVQKNNDLIREEYQLAVEIRKILKDLVAKLGEYKADLILAHEKMVLLDATFAAAVWGIEQKCTFAQESVPEKPLTLLKARHPLLGKSAVPIDFVFLPNCRIVIITGPNTGGKTVTLKTAALFAALNQSGFPIPAAEGSALPVFDNIFADIGDEQSMEQSLSTFSGHMKNIAHITADATENSLVLLDELGSGTDPQEGGAIAMAVLDYLIEKKAYVLVTTHHGILKNYGFTHEICANASVDFDTNTLSPTYRILMGVSGESHALDIADRNGLLPCISKVARNYIVTEQADVSALIRGLTQKHEDLLRLEDEQKAAEQKIREKRRKVDLKELQLRQKELELEEQGYRRLEKFAGESRKKLENLVREIREGEITREKTLKVKQYISDLSDSIENEKKLLESEKDKLLLQKTELEEKYGTAELQSSKAKKRNSGKKTQPAHNGVYPTPENNTKLSYPDGFAENVDVLLNGRRGTIIRQDKKESWIVQFDGLKMSVSQKKLQLAPLVENKPKISIEIAANTDSGGIPGADFSGSNETAVFELRLLGMRYEEAMKAVEHQMDLAVLQHLQNFSIIHGKGNGILQQGVHNFLKHCAVVKDYYFAPPEDGGFGKTYVVLKDI